MDESQTLTESILYLLYTFVVPSKRRGNVGRALLTAAEDMAKSRGFYRLDLTTAKSNIAAQSLYESLGWERDNVFIAYTKSVDVYK